MQFNNVIYFVGIRVFANASPHTHTLHTRTHTHFTRAYTYTCPYTHIQLLFLANCRNIGIGSKFQRNIPYTVCVSSRADHTQVQKFTKGFYAALATGVCVFIVRVCVFNILICT